MKRFIHLIRCLIVMLAGLTQLAGTAKVGVPGPDVPPGEIPQVLAGRDRGGFHLETTPPGAVVSMGLRGLKLSPALFERLPAGRHRVVVKKSGFASQEFTVTIKPAKIEKMHLVLGPQPKRDKPFRVSRIWVFSGQKAVGRYDTISEAVDRAPSGGRLVIGAGEYYENLVIEKPLELMREGDEHDVILVSTNGPCITFRADRALVKGLTLKCLSTAPEPHGAVDISRGTPELQDCRIVSQTQDGVRIHGASTQPVLYECVIESEEGGGIVVFNKAGGRIEGCEVIAKALPCLEIGDGANPVVLRTRLYNSNQCGVLVGPGGRGVIEQCQVAFNQLAGIEIADGGDPVIKGCRIYENQGGGLFIHSRGRGTVTHSDIFGNSLAGVEVTDGSDPVFRYCTVQGGDSNGILVHRGGTGLFEECEVLLNRLANVEIAEGGKPVFVKCRIAEGFSGGVLVRDNGQGHFRECDIELNALAGFEVRAGGAPVIDQQTKIHHGMQAGILVQREGLGRFENCSVFANLSNGFEIRRKGNPFIKQCRIYNNGYYGIRAHLWGKGTVQGCDLTGNRRGGILIKTGGQLDRRDNRL